jgi:ATPase family associated with various cellular activities (AAA)
MLSDDLKDYIHAAFTGIWVSTSEPDEAEKEILGMCAAQENWQVASWDIANGVRVSGHATPGTEDPISALRALPTLASAEGTGILILHNFHRFLQSPEVVQNVFTQLISGKYQRTFLIVLAPSCDGIPVELSKLFVCLEHALPDRAQLEKIARELVSEDLDDFPQGDDLMRVLDASAGLTRYEAEGAYSLSLARKGKISHEVIWELKAQTLKKSNVMTLNSGNEDFANLGGLDSLKTFCARALKPGTIKARGVLLLGPSGTGKSAFCKALGNETGRPTLLMDMGSLMGSLVGQSESNLRAALKVADAMSPCILFVDELEKALSGVGSNGDSGVSSRLFGNLLTWLSDHDSDVFFVGTSNDISKMPPEFSRAERFDGVFFLDLPGTNEKASIWSLYLKMFAISDSNELPNDKDWTGAEIKACCRLATLLGVSLCEAARNIVPVAVTASEKVESLRGWASGRCLSATLSGVYQQPKAVIDLTAQQTKRKVNRPSSASNN